MSAQIRFIADLHLSHANMAFRRGFKDIHEHDEYIIESWNSVVGKRDVTYILGDVTMEKKDPYVLLDRLRGIKHIILGNHDKFNHVPELLKHVNSVAGMRKYKGLWLSHAPLHPHDFDFNIRGNIHGHIHEKQIDDPRYYCVSCERVNYKPVSLSQLGILEQYNENSNT